MPRAITAPVQSRHSFAIKAAAAAVLLVLGDVLFYGFQGGSVLGLFALAWVMVAAIARPAMRRSPAGLVALACAAGYALVLILEPGPLAALLFLIAIGSAALLVRHVFDHAELWAIRLAFLGIRAPFGVLADLWHAGTLPGRSGASAASAMLLNIILPLAGGAFFLGLFASANPVLGNALGAVSLPDLTTLFEHLLLITLLTGFIWPTLRPRAVRIRQGVRAFAPRLPDAPVTMTLVMLGVFSAVFALQNGLDVAFLWSGAPLPEGVTLAEYAHQGAYTLIATALLAGLFVLLVLSPGAPMSQHPLVRRMVLVWVAQNILLVASSMLRLADYIAAYSLTELRIAALVWMVLVACGLVLICWRFMTGKSAAWLINANAIAAGIALTGVSIADFGAVAARWNVDHQRISTVPLDMCYLDQLDSAALIPLIDLRDAPVGAQLQEQALFLSDQAYRELALRQGDWQAWTLRGALRLAKADAMLAGDTRVAAPARRERNCGGSIPAPPSPLPPMSNATLTQSQKP